MGGERNIFQTALQVLPADVEKQMWFSPPKTEEIEGECWDVGINVVEKKDPSEKNGRLCLFWQLLFPPVRRSSYASLRAMKGWLQWTDGKKTSI